MSGLEIITITFSFIIGLGMAQALRSVAFVIRERGRLRLHWVPFVVTAMVMFFQVQFWFGLAVVDSLMEHWNWPVYLAMLMTAFVIFIAGTTVLPPPASVLGTSLIEDFEARGRISLVFLALYLLGWIGVGIMFWIPAFWELVLVNGLMAGVALVAYAVQSPRPRAVLHLLLIAMCVWGSQTVWTTPSLQMPM